MFKVLGIWGLMSRNIFFRDHSFQVMGRGAVVRGEHPNIFYLRGVAIQKIEGGRVRANICTGFKGHSKIQGKIEGLMQYFSEIILNPTTPLPAYAQKINGLLEFEFSVAILVKAPCSP